MNQQLIENIQSALDWEKVKTKHGDTQLTERYYISVIDEELRKLGAVTKGANSSQKSVDFMNVTWPCGTVCSYECKKMNTCSKFKFNDTLPIADVYYIFMYASVQKVQILKGSEIFRVETPRINLRKEFSETVGKHVLMMLEKDEFTNETVKELFQVTMKFISSCVKGGLLSVFDFGQLFKNTFTFGNFSSRARPNWTIDVPYV